MAKYRKKPVVIEAVQFDGTLQSVDGFMPYEAFEYRPSYHMPTGSAPSSVTIQTPEGAMTANHGDYIIKGVNGEFYPCKLAVFHKTYDAEPQPKQLNMTRPLQRMIIERAELTERLDKLMEFLAKDKPMFVEQQQWDLMKNQKIAMDAYHAVLSARIELMSNEDNNHE